jgi:hypothetical protein
VALRITLERRRVTSKSAISVVTVPAEDETSLRGSRIIMMVHQHLITVIVMVTALWIGVGVGEKRNATTETTEERIDMTEEIEEKDGNEAIVVIEVTVDGTETEINVKNVSQNG